MPESRVSQADHDHLDLLCNVGDLAARLAGSPDVASFLDQIVQLVGEHLHSDVCSIYLYDEGTDELVLRATRGLNPESVGEVRLKTGEGLVGMSLKELRPICEHCASSSPHFKAVSGINEEPYESFLAVPILKGIERIGVLVIQRSGHDPFTEDDVRALRATASQLATATETARLLMGLQSAPGRPDTPAKDTPEPRGMVRGRAASPGFARGPAAVLDTARTRRLLAGRFPSEDYTLEDFQAALDRTAEQLQHLQQRLEERLPEMASLIFDAHLMMLKDPSFVGEITSAIESGTSPPRAVLQVGRSYMEMLGASDHAYIREKAQDIEDLLKRLLLNLTGAGDGGPEPPAGSVVIARELHPSDILKLATSGAAGVALVRGGLTSHVSILARSLRLPLVLVNDRSLLSLEAGTDVLIDAEVGNVYVQPSSEVLEAFDAARAARRDVAEAAAEARPETTTADGERIHLRANINLLSDLALAREVRAEGVGLYRSEFPFLIRASLPSEEEQYVIYRRLIEGAEGGVVTFRTLDLGGDKLLAYYDASPDANPALGLRSVRFTLRHRDVFTQQLRAILRAAADHEPLRIMFPMISSLEEFREARGVLDACIDELRSEGLPCHPAPEVGIMVEVPSAVAIIDELAAEAAFLSIGTNDLTQFMLAVDRTNEKVAPYFAPHHPAVLRAMQAVAEAGRRHGAEVSVCGEVAHEPAYAPFLVGIGVGSLSLDPQSLPDVQKRIAAVRADEARRLAESVLAEPTARGTAERLGLAAGSD